MQKHRLVCSILITIEARLTSYSRCSSCWNFLKVSLTWPISMFKRTMQIVNRNPTIIITLIILKKKKTKTQPKLNIAGIIHLFSCYEDDSMFIVSRKQLEHNVVNFLPYVSWKHNCGHILIQGLSITFLYFLEKNIWPITFRVGKLYPWNTKNTQICALNERLPQNRNV